MSKKWLKTENELINLERVDVIKITSQTIYHGSQPHRIEYHLFADDYHLKTGTEEELRKILDDIRVFIIEEYRHTFDLTHYSHSFNLEDDGTKTVVKSSSEDSDCPFI